MNRFQYGKKANSTGKMILSLIVFILILAAFILGFSALSSSTDSHAKDSLETAVNRSIAYCYAVEGEYPSDLEYLKEHYGLVYDEDRYFIDYKLQGANLLPDVTIIEEGE